MRIVLFSLGVIFLFIAASTYFAGQAKAGFGGEKGTMIVLDVLRDMPSALRSRGLVKWLTTEPLDSESWSGPQHFGKWLAAKPVHIVSLVLGVLFFGWGWARGPNDLT